MTIRTICDWEDLVKVLKKSGWKTSSVFGENVYYRDDANSCRIITKTGDTKFLYSSETVKYNGYYPLTAILDDYNPTDMAFFDVITNDYIGINLC